MATGMPSETSRLTAENLVKDCEVEVRRGFIRKVYGILSAQLLLTVLIAAPLRSMGMDTAMTMPLFVIMNVALLGTMCAMCCCQEALRRFPTNYIFLLVLTTAMGVLVGFSCQPFSWDTILLSAGVTMGIFLCMTIYAFTTKTDFTGYGPYLFGALAALMCFGFVLSMLSMCGVGVKLAHVVYDLIGVLLFTFYIVFDTQLIIGGGHSHQFSIDDYVFAAVQLYLDIINLFLHLLSLFGDRS